jgi:hypothetical protein
VVCAVITLQVGIDASGVAVGEDLERQRAELREGVSPRRHLVTGGRREGSCTVIVDVAQAGQAEAYPTRGLATQMHSCWLSYDTF